MSEAPHESHEAPIKTPAQLIAAVIAGFAIPIVVIWLLAYYVNETLRTGAGTNEFTDAAIAKRIAPLAQVNIRDASAPRVYKTGQQVYEAVCFACHATGTAGAPKFGVRADWAPHLMHSYDQLLQIALTGFNAMPPRGGTSPDDYSDYEIARALVYMANHSGAQFAEPPAPAANSAPTPNENGMSSSAEESPANGDANTNTNTNGSAEASAANAQAAAAMAALAHAPPAHDAAPAAPAAPSTHADAAQTGKALYQQICQTCHATGLMNAPKFGDKAAWAPRLKEPMEVVYRYALQGKNLMPPKGGSSASDADVKAAVDYMVNAVK